MNQKGTRQSTIIRLRSKLDQTQEQLWLALIKAANNEIYDEEGSDSTLDEDCNIQEKPKLTKKQHLKAKITKKIKKTWSNAATPSLEYHLKKGRLQRN